MNENMSPADVAAVVGNTDRNNFGYAYPVFPYGGGFGNNGFGGGYGADWLWIFIIIALFGGFNGNGNGFGGGFNNDYAWLSNGQKEIMQNTNEGFNTLHLSNQVEGVRDGIHDIQNAICNSTASINSNISNGFYNAEIGANNRQMANMQQNFNNQIATLQGFNGLSSDLASCCCENRLGIQDLKSTVISENCADREALREVGQSILVNQNQNTQKIIDEIFRDRLDEKDDKIAELNRQLQLAELKASQIAQTDAITANIYNELKNCPVRNSSSFWKPTNIYLL